MEGLTPHTPRLSRSQGQNDRAGPGVHPGPPPSGVREGFCVEYGDGRKSLPGMLWEWPLEAERTARVLASGGHAS